MVAFVDSRRDSLSLLQGLTAFLDAEVVPRHEENKELLENPRRLFEENGRQSEDVVALAHEVRQASAAAGYYTMFVPEDLGGGGMGSRTYFDVWEHIFHHYGVKYSLAIEAVSHWARGPSHLFQSVKPVVRDRVLPGLLAGDETICFGMSEPDAGSDALGMRTTANRDGDEWILNGSKTWISNSYQAQNAIIFAVTDRGLGNRARVSAFLVPTDSPGFKVEANIKMFNELGASEATVFLDDVSVPEENVMGEIHHGFGLAMSGVAYGRLYNSAKAVGLGRWALETAIEYVQRRTAFGAPIATYQGVTFPLAESAMEIHAAHLVGLDCARRIDEGEQATKELSMSKAYATEAAVRAVDRSIQVHGAIGFTTELGLTKAYEWVRRICVADGTSEILRRSIVKAMLAGDMEL